MKTFSKRLLTMLLAVAMVFGLSGMTAFAAEADEGGIKPLAEDLNDVAVYRNGDQVFTITEEAFREAEDQTEFSTKTYYNGANYGIANDVYARFVPVKELLGEDFQPDDGCGAYVQSNTSNCFMDMDNFFLYDDSGTLRSAEDGSRGAYWVSGVTSITLGHDYDANGICRICGQEKGAADDYDVKYAVCLWGINQDHDKYGNELGLTFGPATGADYTATYEAHLTEAEYKAGENGVCLHWMSWAQIAEQSMLNPHAFDECLKNGCTHSVNIKLNSVLTRTSYEGTMEKGDGVGAIYESLQTKYLRYNSSNNATGGWPASQVRAVLNGKDKQTGSYASDAPDAADCLYSCFPSDLQDVIVARAVSSDTVYNSESEDNVTTTYDKLSLPSGTETYEAEGSQDDPFRSNEGELYQRSSQLHVTTDDAAALTAYDETNTAISWRLRTLARSGSSAVCLVAGNGSYTSGTPNAYSNIGLTPFFCLAGTDRGVDESYYDVKYAVTLWGINHDKDEEGNTLGLTFGPATGADYRNDYHAHLTEDQYNNGEGFCLHWMSWEDIAKQSAIDPEVFRTCLKEGCTHAVNLVLNDTLLDSCYADEMDDGDGVGYLYHSISSHYRLWATFNTSWAASEPRAVLNGADSLMHDSYVNYWCDEGNCLLTCFPRALQKYIVAKEVKADTVSDSYTEENNMTTYDKLWFFSAVEIWGTYGDYNDNVLRPLEGSLYERSELLEITTNSNNSLLTAYNEEASTGHYWYTRSLNNDSQPSGIVTVLDSGKKQGYYANSTNVGFAPGFCLAGPEGGLPEDDSEAFAVYSEDGNSLSFYMDQPPAEGDTYDGKTVTAVYTGLETLEAGSAENVPWHDIAGDVTDVVIDDSFAQARPVSLAFWFNGFSNAAFSGLENMDTSSVTDMEGLFQDCSALTDAAVSGWDVKNVTRMNGMFQNCAKLESLDLAGWDTHEVVYYNDFAVGCTSLQWIRFGDDFDLFAKSNEALVSQQYWYDSPEDGNEVSDSYMMGISGAGTYYTYTEEEPGVAQPTVSDVVITSNLENNTKDYDEQEVILTVDATQDPADAELSYQWYKKNEAGEYETYGGVMTENTLTLTGNVADSGTYMCEVTASVDDVPSDPMYDEITITIMAAAQDISYAEKTLAGMVGDTVKNPLTVTKLSTDDEAEITYESDDPSIAQVDEESNVTLLAAGEATITATAVGTPNFAEASASYTITISEAAATVNKDALEAAIAAAGDLVESEYTPESWAALAEALTAAVAADEDPNATQGAVDAACDALTTAMEDLVKAADKDALEAAIAVAGDLVESEYTPESWTALAEALTAAKAAAEDPNASQDAVDAACDALTTAMEDLVKAADKDALEKAIEAAEDLNEEDYTPESWAALAEALTAAKAAAEDPNASQDAVDAACDALQAAIGGLVVITPDKVVLEAAIEIAADLTESDYTAKSWETLTRALDKAKEVFADETAKQSEVNQAEVDLIAAIAGLEGVGGTSFNEADKRALLDAYVAGTGLSESDYTAESWEPFGEALEDAEKVLLDVDATQGEVDDALSALNTARDGLVEKPTTSEPTPGSGGTPKNGLCRIESGVRWGYYVNDVVDTSFTGFVHNENGDWYVRDGYVIFADSSANGVFKDKTGAIGDKGTWYYVVRGKVQHDFTGLANYKNENGWWYIKQGVVDFTHNGVDKNKNGWWYVVRGKVRFTFTGLAHYRNANGWWYIKKGKVDFTHNGVDKNQNGWWYVTGGKVRFNFTGLSHYRNANGWWYINAGKVTFRFNGIASNQNGTWYISNSKVQFGFNGTVRTVDGITYTVRNGKVM